MPLPALHERFVRAIAKTVMAPDLSLRGRTAPVAIRTSRLRSCLRRLPFFLRRKKGRKERRQNQGFEILSAAEVLPVPVSFSHANQDKQISCLAFTWPLRLHLRRAPRLCWPILTGLFSASLVGRGAHTPPPKFAWSPCTHLSLRTSDRRHWRGNPRPMSRSCTAL